MGIFNRLGNVIKSYLDDDDSLFEKSRFSGDPDFDAAFEELEEFLGKSHPKKPGAYANTGSGGKEYNRSAGGGAKNTASSGTAKKMDESLKADFSELGLDPGASPEECKAAYKRLLKQHHPDRHAGSEANTRKATEKTARINAAYERVEKWHQTNRGTR